MILEVLESNPWIVVAIGIAMRAVLAYQRELTWPEYRAFHAFKRATFPLLDRIEPFDYHWFVISKSGRDHRDYIGTVAESPKALIRRLSDGDGKKHLVCSLKSRPDSHGDRYHAGDVVWLHDDDRQTHAYVYRNDDGTTDLYCHEEPAVTNPLEHLTPEQNAGDPRGVLPDSLESVTVSASE